MPGSRIASRSRRIALVVAAQLVVSAALATAAQPASASFGFYCVNHEHSPYIYCLTSGFYYANDSWSLRVYRNNTFENCAAAFDSAGNMYYNPVCSSNPNVDPHHTYYGQVPLRGASGVTWHGMTLTGELFWCSGGPC